MHHVVKDHPYRKIATSLEKDFVRRQKSSPTILGLTASLTYAQEAGNIKKAIDELVAKLRVNAILTVTDDELSQGGYNGGTIEDELRKLDLEHHVIPGLVAVADRKPHLTLSTFWDRVDAKKASPFTTDLLRVIAKLESLLSPVLPSFVSPMRAKKTAEWAEYVLGIKVQGTTGTVLQQTLAHCYEAVRILVNSWEQDQDISYIYLEMSLGPIVTGVSEATIEGFLKKYSKILTFAKFVELEDVLLQQAASRPADLRAIVFVQTKVSAHVVAHFINHNRRMSSAGLEALHLYAADSPATPILRLSKAKAKEHVAKFADARINILVTTYVAEEGMDVPQANCVVRFDPLLNAVSLIQGRGRARQAASSHVVLTQRNDRTLADLVDAERLQRKLVRDFCPSELDPAVRITADRESQTAREKHSGAHAALRKGGQVYLYVYVHTCVCMYVWMHRCMHVFVCV